MFIRNIWMSLVLSFFLLFMHAGVNASNNNEALLSNYSDIAFASYEDSLKQAVKLQRQVRKLVNKPSAEQLEKTKQAWLLARIPYSQSEVFRFGNPIVDDWEGKVNAWPLDEGLIDYIVEQPESAGNWFATANVIANQQIDHAEYSVNAQKINHTLLEMLHSIGDIETNVATGYHAIEFLLWGQDVNGTNKGSGDRQYTDFDRKKCSNEYCFRRGKYLQMSVDLLVKDLTFMVKQWQKPTVNNETYVFVQGKEQTVFNVGLARQELLEKTDNLGVSAMLIGMGSLAYGELAGERTKLGLLIHDPEEEQDCFSDNTHWSHYYNLKGIDNIYHGRYARMSDEVINGASIQHMVKKLNPDLDVRVVAALEIAKAKAQMIVDSAEKDQIAYDQLLAKTNVEGHHKLNQFIDSLLILTELLSEVASELKLENVVFEGSDSLTNSSVKTYFQ